MTALALVANAGDGTISTFALDGGLTRLAVNPVGTGVSTFAIDASRDLVYAGIKGDRLGIVTLGLNRDTGQLTEIAHRGTDASFAYLALTPDGAHLLGASYGGGYGLLWPVTDGELGPESPRIEYPNLHAVAVTSGGRHAYFASLGADLIAGYDLADGRLTPLPSPTAEAPSGSGPRHLVLNRAEDALYVLTEFSGEALHYRRNPDGSLHLVSTAIAHDPTKGLGRSVFGANPLEHHYIWGADLWLNADETQLWCSERTESTLACVPVGPDGRLSDAGWFGETETQPRGFCISGEHLIATGERSQQVALYTITPEGTLELVERAETGNAANWVRIIG
ncbi:MAG: beta-propeller fold lactonase family protein [Micropruina sp.]|nr:beta-propeller fold lactonase family protein [Micropruina sp.]